MHDFLKNAVRVSNTDGQNMIRLIIVLAFTAVAVRATQREIGDQMVGMPKDIAADFTVRESRSAAKRVVEFYAERGSAWEKEARPYRAESVTFSRAPLDSGATLKKGDPIWIVVVVNDAQSSIAQIPVGIVWVRAKDGAVFESAPKEANQEPEQVAAAHRGMPR